MLATDLDHVTEQIALTPMMEKAITFLQQTRGQELKDERIEIDGNKVYALVQSYETVATDTARFEAHRKYIDVQYVASGIECIGWAPTELLQSPTAYDESSDAWFGTVPLDKVTSIRLSAGQLAVLYPTDAHAPKQAVGEPTQVNKIVVKVIIE